MLLKKTDKKCDDKKLAFKMLCENKLRLIIN